MKKEVESLLTTKNVQYIPFDSDVLVQSYKRGMKREKPFKTNDDSLRENFDFIEDASWINDALIIESLIKACNTIDKNKDTLLFCSNNTKDFAEYDKESDKHHLHPDIKKDIRVETKYYLRLPDMLEKEFMESLSKETKENIKEAEKFHGSLLEQVLKDRLMRERNLKEFIAAGMGQTGLLGEMAEARDKWTKDFAKVVEAQNKWDNALKIRRLGLVDWDRMSEQSGLFSENKKERDETESTSGSKNKDETTSD